MILDYRIYCTLYALLVIMHCYLFAMVRFADGRYFYRYAWAEASFATILLLGNYLDWLWS